MKKNSHTEQDSKVIPFPNLHNRLAEKGLDLLQNRNFKEALYYLQQAVDIEFHPDFELGIILCLFELGELDEAKQKCEKMLKEDLSDYFQVLHIYVSILVQQGNYLEVQSILEAVLDEDRIPANMAESLFKVLDFCRKMNKDQKNQQIQELKHHDYDEINNRLNISHNVQEQWQVIQQLRETNLFKILPLLKIFLENTEKHPMLKTIILELLKEHGMDHEVNVEKFGTVQSFNPTKLQNIIDNPFTGDVLALIDDQIKGKNPTLFEVIKEIWLRYLFVLYPFLPQPETPSLWAAALYKLGCEMHGIEINESLITEFYSVSKNNLEDCYNNLLKIEEISFLQI